MPTQRPILAAFRAQSQVRRDAFPLLVVEPIHFPIVGRVKAEEVIGKRFPLDGGKIIELRLEIRLVPRTRVEGVGSTLVA